MENEYLSIFKDYTCTTNSPEAYRYYIYGKECIYKTDYPNCNEIGFHKLLAIDSNFILAIRHSFFMHIEIKKYMMRQKNGVSKLYKKRDKMYNTAKDHDTDWFIPII